MGQLRLGPLCTTSGNSGPSARQTPGAGPSTHRSTDDAPPLWCGHLNPTCTSVELGTASGLVLPQPKPGPQFTILLGPGLGTKWRKIFFLQW